MKLQIFLKCICLNVFILSNIYAQQTLTIGTIDTQPNEKLITFEPFAKYLEEKLKYQNIKVHVEVPKDINTAVILIKHKKLDIYIDSVYPTLLIQNQTNIDIESKRWKNGNIGYKSVIFVNKNSGIRTLSDLEGKRIAFEDEFSTSAYFVPKKAIENAGLSVSNEGAKSVRYSFARSEENAAVWLLYGKVDASVTDDITYEGFDKKLFRVIYKSNLIPRHLVSFSNTVDKKLKKTVLAILYDMHKNTKGQEILKRFSKTKKFSPLTNNDIDLIKGYK